MTPHRAGTARLLLVGALAALTAFAVPGSAVGAAPTGAGPGNRLDGLERPVKGEGRAQPEEYATGRQGLTSRVLTQTSATTSTQTSLAGATGVEPTAERVVGTLSVAGGSSAVTDAAAAATASVTDRSSTRHSGATRYLTAVALSKAGFPTGAGVAFLATGEDFPDGLAASAVAGVLGGPVLLTATKAIDAATLAEFVRLNPSRTYVAGGVGAVSDAAVNQLKAAVPGMTVTRVSGADRAATAAALARLVPTQSRAAFVATTANFPDALGAAPAAAKLAAPLLLSASSSLSSAAQQELSRLRPATTYVLGGTSAISDAVVTQIRKASGGAVVRLSGADRYQTAAAVSARFFTGLTEHLTMATGVSFPDALGAGALAARLGGPLLLASSSSAPPRATLDEAKRISWYVPSSGTVIRYVLVTHPDDEMSARALLGPPDPHRFDIFVLLTRGETSSYCNGKPVSNTWSSQEYLPQPQPTGLPLSDRCRKHRVDSWDTFLGRTDLAEAAQPERRSGSDVVVDGQVLPKPLHLDADGVEVPADFYDVYPGSRSARIVFDLGEVQQYEVVWALENARMIRDQIAPGATEGDVIGAGFVNRTSVGSADSHPDHVAVYRTIGTFDFRLPGSQYHAVGHTEEGRAFGAWAPTYCADMCHPGGTSPYIGPMGNFQYSYGWLAAGRWKTGTVDATAGFSEYQSFAKWF